MSINRLGTLSTNRAPNNRGSGLSDNRLNLCAYYSAQAAKRKHLGQAFFGVAGHRASINCEGVTR
jgi:hypothetical protein